MVLMLEKITASNKGKKIIEGVNLEIEEGKISILMGPNGAGKSTISNVIMGNPAYTIDSGNLILNGEEINEIESDERARKGIFMSFQNPIEIPGVTLAGFLRTSYNLCKNEKINTANFHKLLKEKMEFLGMDPSFRARELNKGFSGGEKKRSELLQLLLLEPKYAILDEIDSGLDVDGIKLLIKIIEKVRDECNTGFLIITHNPSIIDFFSENISVYLMKDGKIVQRGGNEIAKQISKTGFLENGN